MKRKGLRFEVPNPAQAPLIADNPPTTTTIPVPVCHEINPIAAEWFPELAGAPAGKKAAPVVSELRATLAERVTRAEYARHESPWDDPRPDLVEDSAAWMSLLARAYAETGRHRLGDNWNASNVFDGPWTERPATEATPGEPGSPESLFATLHGLRCVGVRLVTDPRGGWRLDRAVMEQAEYERLRDKWLVPHREMLGKFLREIPV